MRYVSYSDESGTGSRFTSIASFSLHHDAIPSVNDSLRQILAESGIAEFKWQKIKDAKYRFCASKLLKLVWSLLGPAKARIDVIVWDNHDTRHAVFGRDDKANFERMYFHLHSAAMKKRPKNARWRLLPDERFEIDWNTVSQCVAAVGQRKQLIESPLFGDFFSDPHYSVDECKQVRSHEEPCIQVADLFAGLAVFSRTHYDAFEQWKTQLVPDLGLFDESALNLTNREENRFQVLKEFNQGCKSRRLGVSLRTRRCLNTPRPSNPLNFWHYEPQHDLDQAPTRGRS